jgi:hypothetical protein
VKQNMTKVFRMGILLTVLALAFLAAATKNSSSCDADCHAILIDDINVCIVQTLVPFGECKRAAMDKYRECSKVCPN